MSIEKLNIQEKADNPNKKALLARLGVPQDESLSAQETNKLVGKTNELVDKTNELNQKIDAYKPVTAFNFKGNKATYAELASIVNPQKDDAYGVIADGLVYIYNGTAFPTLGNGLNLGLKPTSDSKVAAGNELAVSGGKVFVSTVQKDSLEKKISSNNKFDKTKYQKEWINSSGVIAASVNSLTTDYIENENRQAKTIFIAGYDATNTQRANIYNSNKEFIRVITMGVNRQFNLNANEAYYRVYFKGAVGEDQPYLDVFQVNENQLYPYDSFSQSINKIEGTPIYTPYITDVVEYGNLNPVKSDAVFRFFEDNKPEIDEDKICYNDEYIRENLNKLNTENKELISLSNTKILDATLNRTVFIENNQGKEIDNAIICLTLHKGNAPFTNNSKVDLYLGEDVRNDFSDIKFLDNGKILNHKVESHGNYGLHPTNQSKFNVVGWRTTLCHNDGVNNNVYISTTEDFSDLTIIKSNATAIGLNILDDVFYVKTADVNKVYKSTKLSNYTDETLVHTGATDANYYSSNFRTTDDGTVFMSPYQERFDAKIYRSTDNGNTFTLVYSDTFRQHVHNIAIDRSVSPNKVYVSFDGNITHVYPNSAGTFKSEDLGTTWEFLPIGFNTDYGVLCCLDNVRIGGGEGAIKDTPTIYRTEDDINWEIVLEAETMSMLCVAVKDILYLSFTARKGGNCYPKILRSSDKGKTWETVNDSGIIVSTTNSNGYRYGSRESIFNRNSAIMSFGGEEFTDLTKYPIIQILEGGNNYQALVYVNIGKLPIGGKEIVLTNGYIYNNGLNVNVKNDFKGDLFNAELNSKYGFTKINNNLYPMDLTSYKDNFSRTAFLEPLLSRNFKDNFGVYCENPIITNESLVTNNNFTISFWHQPISKTAITGHNRLFFGDNNCQIRIVGTAYVIVKGDTIINSATVGASMMYRSSSFITITANNGTYKFFRNGVLFQEIADLPINLEMNNIQIFGKITTVNTQNYLQGINVFSKVLNSDEVLEMYERGKILREKLG